ncbi:MAG TPA: flagellar basal-body MS-ring/collar protein FliF [Macromonas sp.]|nr:flagellar basal-body MS-ring/collar protein FliF [Macromonas sp.]
MNTAVAQIDTPMPANPASPLLASFARLSNTRKLMLGLGSLAMVGVVAMAFYLSNQPDYRVLYANLSDKDGGAVLAQLSQMNIPYKHADGGGAILIPADKVHDTRLKLASQGLPRGSTVGFELLDTNRLGMTQFQERLTFQRGLEGELVRSITALSSVADARVHLALPNQNGFFREQQKPSASVLLTLHSGRTLDRSQIAGIVHLVASSVPELNPKAVSVLDQSGTLLSQTPDGEGSGLDSQQLEYTRTLEQMYTQRILDLLEPIIGRENVRAQVTADMDYSLTEQTSEQHRPNQNGEPSSVRSQQLIETGSAVGKPISGVPGAVSNAAPGPTTAPINATQAAPVGVTANGASAGSDPNMRREQVINYEVDKTVVVKRNATGTVRRLTAAVVLNHRNGTDKRGQATSTALPAEEMAKITALVREAIGFSQDRGDSVNVLNAAFTKPATDTSEVAWWKEPETQDLLHGLAKPLGVLLLGLILFLGMVRPTLKMMKAPPEKITSKSKPDKPQLSAVVDDEQLRPALPQPVQNVPTDEMLRLEDAKRLAIDNPAAVANIIKGWVNGEAGAAES